MEEHGTATRREARDAQEPTKEAAQQTKETPTAPPAPTEEPAPARGTLPSTSPVLATALRAAALATY